MVCPNSRVGQFCGTAVLSVPLSNRVQYCHVSDVLETGYSQGYGVRWDI